MRVAVPTRAPEAIFYGSRANSWMRHRLELVHVRKTAAARRSASAARSRRASAGCTLTRRIAWRGGRRVGLIVYRLAEDHLEVHAIRALRLRQGTGSRLLAAVEAQAASLNHIRPTTTNDSTDALFFYQRRGYRIEAWPVEGIPGRPGSELPWPSAPPPSESVRVIAIATIFSASCR
jgi:GNAT superfamily N-acetyltransferase